MNTFETSVHHDVCQIMNYNVRIVKKIKTITLNIKKLQPIEQKNIILAIEINILRAVSNTMQKTKKRFYNIQKIKERRKN